MNILYTNFHFDAGGGHTTYILALVRDNRHNSFVACPGGSLLHKKLSGLGFANLLDMSFPFRLTQLRGIIATVRRLKAFIEDNSIDIVHTNGSADNRIVFYTSLFCRRKFKIVFTKHNSYKIRGAVSRWRFNNINDAVIFVSESIRGSIGFSHFKTPVTVIENGIDLEHWKKSGDLAGHEPIVLISNAGTSLSKGWFYLPRALGLLPEEQRVRFRVRLLGTPRDAEEWAKAASLCSFEYAGFSHDPRAELEEADIGYVLSCDKETISFACREMMAMSLPVLVSDYAGLPHNVDESCGWVTKTADAASISQALAAILRLEPEELTAMKLAARARAEKHFSIEEMLDKTNALYERVLRQGG